MEEKEIGEEKEKGRRECRKGGLRGGGVVRREKEYMNNNE